MCNIVVLGVNRRTLNQRALCYIQGTYVGDLRTQMVTNPDTEDGESSHRLKVKHDDVTKQRYGYIY